MTDQSNDAQRIGRIQGVFKAYLQQEAATADKHAGSAYFTTSRGHNLSYDERQALHYARRLQMAPSDAEAADALAYLSRLLTQLEELKTEFRRSEEDPEGFGIATLHGLTRALEAGGR